MSKAKSGILQRTREWLDRTWPRLVEVLGLTTGARLDPRADQVRFKVLVALSIIGFALFGNASLIPWLRSLGDSPFNLDRVLGTTVLGWTEPKDIIPLTLVDIDESTYRELHSPPVMPRPALIRLLDVATQRRPLAVVVDIDLSWGSERDAAEAPGLRLEDFLREYARAAPLIFVKRVDAREDGQLFAVASPFDEIFTGNGRLAWAHAHYATDGDGKVRRWSEWIELCKGDAHAPMPSIPVRLVAVSEAALKSLRYPTGAPGQTGCGESAVSGTHMVVLGPRITGPKARFSDSAQHVSARYLLDPQAQRDDAQLFDGRVVLIGATHSAANDQWRTAHGVLPGVELIANTVRYAPLQLRTGFWPSFWFRFLAILLFVSFAASVYFLRPLLAASLSALFAIIVVAIGLKSSFYGVLAATEAAVLVFIQYKAVDIACTAIQEGHDVKWRMLLAKRFWKKAAPVETPPSAGKR